MRHNFRNVTANFPNIASRSVWKGVEGSYNIGIKYHRGRQPKIDADVTRLFSNLTEEGLASGKISEAPLPANTPLTVLDDKYPDKYWAQGYNLIKAQSKDVVSCFDIDGEALIDLEDITHGSIIDCSVDFYIYTDREGNARISANLLEIMLTTPYVKKTFVGSED